MEWRDKFNSFNSDKVLLHSDRLQAIADWLKGRRMLPAPLEVSFDPIHSCNLMCQHCNAHRYLSENKSPFSPILLAHIHDGSLS